MSESAQASQPATRMISRVLGPFLVIVDVTAVARSSHMQSLLSQFEANSLWTFVTGAFVLLFGLIVVAVHPYWHGPAAIIVSSLGWLIVLRGLLLVAFPRAFAAVADSMIGAQAWWVALCVVFALVGVYLTYVGWRAVPNRPTTAPAAVTPDVPRAA